MCTPVAALQGERVEGAVVSGIGRGALQKLTAAKILAPARLGREAVVRTTIASAGRRSLYQVASRIEQDGRMVARASAKFIATASPVSPTEEGTPR
jgi:hypothetical protein